VYELSNHLQNVLATVSDKKIGVDVAPADGIIDYYTADVITANDYAPFGALLPGRKYSNGSKFRYGFNGKENDNEVKGEGNQQDYGLRIYDPRLGKFLSVDPLTKSYPHYTPYSYAGNKPIKFIDLDGAEEANNTGDYNFNNLMNWVGGHSPNDNPFNKDNPIGKLSDNFNPLAICNNYACKLLYGKDSHRQPIDYRGKTGVVTDLGTDVVLYLTAQKIFKVILGTKNAPQVMEQQLAKNEAAIGSTKPAPTPAPTTTKKLQVGEYKAMTQANAKTGLSSDHIPSFASVKKYTENLLGKELNSVEEKLLRQSTLTIVYETEIHQEISRTFAGRNNPMKIAQDAGNLIVAIQRDIQALTPSLLRSGYSQTDINAAQQTLIQKYLPPTK
jgi:RHS repeat-associated protein